MAHCRANDAAPSPSWHKAPEVVISLKTIQPLLASFCVVAVTSAAFAETRTNEKDLAVYFFDQGIQKLHEGACDASPMGNLDKCGEAREMFSRAHDLDPNALGTLRNLAQLEQRLGLLARSVRHFRELARKAPLDPKPERRTWAKLANSAIEALLPRLGRLTVSVTAPAPTPDIQLKIDDEPVPSAAWGAPLEFDAGEHTVTAVAPGCAAFEQRIDLKEGEAETMRVELAPVATATAGSASPSSGPLSLSAGAPTDTKGTAGAIDTNGSQGRAAFLRATPWVVVGAGGLALAVGGAFGAAALAQYSTACPQGGPGCNRQEYDKGAHWADASTVLFVAGGAAVAGGLIWHFATRPHVKNAAPSAGAIRPSVGLATIGLTGYFQ